jgi:hypothetical protein
VVKGEARGGRCWRDRWEQRKGAGMVDRGGIGFERRRVVEAQLKNLGRNSIVSLN